MDSFLTELAKSGPWALVAGFLMWSLVKERQTFQSKVTDILADFKDALVTNTHAIEKLIDRLDVDVRELIGKP